jgi:TIGR00159 family protein
VFSDFIYPLIDLVTHIKITDIIDILIIAYLTYKLYELMKETRAEQLVKGIFIIFIALRISEILNLRTFHWILSNTMTVGLMAIIVVFQPELRRILEQLGRTNIISRVNSISKESDTINEVVQASLSLSRQKIGALIVFERKTGINEIIQTGTDLNADVSRELLINIFIPNTPLHDGAVVIRRNYIKAAACFLPLTENKNLNKDLGTRHRAALGITEKSDCLSLVVSEETGSISIAINSKLYRDLNEERLRNMLTQNLISEKTKSDPDEGSTNNETE